MPCDLTFLALSGFVNEALSVTVDDLQIHDEPDVQTQPTASEILVTAR